MAWTFREMGSSLRVKIKSNTRIYYTGEKRVSYNQSCRIELTVQVFFKRKYMFRIV